MVEPLRHRQTKGAGTDMLSLTSPRHTSTLPILLKNSNFRGDHNSEARWQPRWKFPWGLSGATDLSACDPLLGPAVATTRGDNTMRAEAGFSRHRNFRLFQQYRQIAARSSARGNGSSRLELNMAVGVFTEESECQERPEDKRPSRLR